MNIAEYIEGIGRQAKTAAGDMSRAATAAKNLTLEIGATLIEEATDSLEKANAMDVAAAESNRLDAAMIDRLKLTPPRLAAMTQGMREVAALADPIGAIQDLNYRPSGIQVGRMRVPLGVIGMIYESRPNVTVDAASLCIKSGNACVLRGGSESIHTNRALAELIRAALAQAGLPPTGVQLIDTTDRQAVAELLRMDRYLDVVIPRGGKGLVELISRESKVPVIKHLDGNCHVYVDDRADFDKATRIVINAKTQRYGVCNAMETLLVAEGIARTWLPDLLRALREIGVELRGCPQSCDIDPLCVPALEDDWDTEYLAPILAVKIVPNMDAAIEHIARHGSQHTDAIVTEDWSRARQFLREVDSSSVMVNASTRFADGFEYGLGAEIGISTDKLHARGPVGLEGLTTQKYVVFGDGQIRA